MASGGTITGTTSNQYIDAKVEWWISNKDVTNNTSTITAALYYKRNNTGYTTSGSGRYSIKIGDRSASVSATLTITEHAWVKAMETSYTVSHNADGSKSLTISATGSIPDTSFTQTYLSSTVTLDPIPRETQITSLYCDTHYFTGKITYQYLPRNSSFYSECRIYLGSSTWIKSIYLGKNTAGTNRVATVTLSASELSTIYKKLPNSTDGIIRFVINTYSDSSYYSLVGNPQYKEITLSIPNTTDTQPTATITLTPVPSLLNGLYIKGRSKLTASITDITGKYGAEVKSCKVAISGKSYSSPYTTGYLITEGDVPVTCTLTDSRGFQRTYTKTITVMPYETPRIIPASNESSIVCARCDENGKLSESGTFLKIKAKRRYSKVVSSGVQKNFCSIRYRYKADGTDAYSSWTTILATDAQSDEIETSALKGAVLDSTRSYIVQIGVIDTLGVEDIVTISIPTDRVYTHRAGSISSLGIGKYVEEENTVDIAEDITLKIRGKVNFAGEAWNNLGLSENVADSNSNCGRYNGTGCYYRVCADKKHVYVAFNCSFTYAGTALQVNKDTIPEKYRPKRNAYAMCATGGRAIARILVNDEGNVLVDWIQVITTTETTTSSTVKWIDGYIDYWL